MCHDTVQPISTLPNTEFTFNNVPVTDNLILLFLRLLRDFLIFGRSSECRSCDLNLTFPAPGDRFAISVDLVNQRPLRIAAITISVSLHGLKEIALSHDSATEDPAERLCLPDNRLHP